MADKRDLTITVTAYLKSIIEAGIPMDQWGEHLKTALNTHKLYVRKMMEAERKQSGKA